MFRLEMVKFSSGKMKIVRLINEEEDLNKLK